MRNFDNEPIGRDRNARPMSEFSSTETAAPAAAPSPPPEPSTSEAAAPSGPRLSNGDLRAHVARERQARQARQAGSKMRDLHGPTPAPAPPPAPSEPALADDFPRFWKKEWAGDWGNLPPELRAKIRDRENERDAHINRTRSEFDQLRRQY